jgi:pimeloyl-ACP methyl ester carboxylesterase
MRIVGWAVAVAVAACAGGAFASGTGAAQTPGPPVLTPCRLEHPLKIASEPALCGTVTVPENPAEPAGATIDLRVAVVKALNRRSTAPPLFLLAGGPGQSAIDMYASFASAFARINRDHDLVMLDQRGTGRSNPLSCDYPEDWDSAGDDLSGVRAATSACLAKLGDRVRFYTSSVAVTDLDTVRTRLKFPVIDLYGVSYGTRMAELYMRRYPANVHAAILDGVVDPEQALGYETPLDGERALRQIVTRCGEANDCAKAYPRLAAELAELRARYGAEKTALKFDDPSTGLPRSVEFNRGMLNAALRFLSYSGSEASLLPTLIHEAAGGDLAPLAAQTLMLARQVKDQLAIGMQNSVICSEDAPLFGDAAAQRAHIGASYQGTDQLDALRAICAIWPRGPVDTDLHAPLRSDVPTLLLAGEADPVTPPEAAERVARSLSRHRLIVLAGEGHGQLGTGCVPRLMAQFLDADEPERLDVSCLAQHTPAPFFVRSTGPSP